MTSEARPTAKPTTWEIGQRWGWAPGEYRGNFMVATVDPVTVTFGNGSLDRMGWPAPLADHVFLGWAPGFGPTSPRGGAAGTSLAGVGSLGSSCSPSKAAPVPWPEPTVGSKWDRYRRTDGDFRLDSTGTVRQATATRIDFVEPGMSWTEPYWLSREGFPGGGAYTIYVPAGWDYATKQPKAGTTEHRRDSACEAGFCVVCNRTTERPAVTEAKPEPRAAAPGEGSKEYHLGVPACRHRGPHGRPTRDTDGVALCMACYVEADGASRRAMDTSINGAGACLIDQEEEPRPRVEASRAYPEMLDLDGDIPDAGR